MGSFADFLRNNFWHVAPIITVGVIGLAIMLERGKALLLAYPMRNQGGFFQRIRDHVLADRLADAIALCDAYKGKLVAEVVREVLLRAHQPEAMIEDGLDLAVREAVEKIQKRTSFLSTIANVSTLLGLLGTIVGLIASFESVGNANPQQRSALLAAGISTAMNATMMGLAVAIPCMLAFAYLINLANHLIGDVDKAGIRILDIVRQRYYSAEVESQRSHQGNGHGGHGKAYVSRAL